MENCIYCLPWPTIWAFISATATVIVAIIAWNELSKSRKISNAQFIQDFKKQFFSPINTELFMLFSSGLIKYHEDNKGDRKLPNLPEDFSYFEVTLKDFKRKKNDIPSYLGEISNVYSEYEIDDYILGHFEDLGLFEENGVMTIDTIDEVFGLYIKMTGDNEDIQKYISDIRKYHSDNSIYDKFLYLYNKLKERK